MNSPALQFARPAAVVPVARVDSHGRIGPNRPVVTGAVALFLTLTGATLTDLLADGNVAATLCLASAALAAAGIATRALDPACDIYWNEDGLEGPCARAILPFAPASRFIAWDAVVSVRSGLFGRVVVTDRDGTSIGWNAAYCGIGPLRRVLGRLAAAR